ncbi:hypothetical protein [Variovorax sp. UC122_21]
MSNPEPEANTSPTDADFIEFAQQVFELARTGDAQTLERLLQKGFHPT